MKDLQLTRRHFLLASAAAATVLPACRAAGQEFRGRLRKAMIIQQVTEAALEPLKEAGFDGVETRHICPEDEAERGRKVAEEMGMRVHSVMRGWMEFNSDNPQKVDDSLESTRKALRAARAYGADDILLVPCKIGGMPMPEAWEFDIEFDEKTGHVTRVVKGDNSK